MVLQRAFEHEAEVPEGFQVAGGAAVGLLKVRQRMLGRMRQSARREGKMLVLSMQRSCSKHLRCAFCSSWCRPYSAESDH
jgi:hypothetical protein